MDLNIDRTDPNSDSRVGEPQRPIRGRGRRGRGLPGQGSGGGGAPKMAASMCDVFSFCMGVAGRARVSVEVRFVSSSKVRPEETPAPSGLGTSLAGPLAARSREGSRSVAAHRLRGGHAVCRPPRLRARPLPRNRAAAAGGAGGAEGPGAPGPGRGSVLLGPGRGGRGCVSRGSGDEKPWVLGELPGAGGWVLGCCRTWAGARSPGQHWKGLSWRSEVPRSLLLLLFIKVRCKNCENACEERR